EVTRREVRAWLDTGPPDLDGRLATEVETWTEETLDWPASFLDRAEARACCASRGLRLPTAGEWLRIASGPRVQPWPWGATEIQSVANTLALRLDRACPVGTFEQGRTPLGVYDLLGNVWEWVEEPLDAAAPSEASAWCMGGSFASRPRRLFEIGPDGRLVFHAQELDPGSRSTDVGLRAVAVARDWFRAHAAALGGGAKARERLVRIGARWGSEAAPALERLAREPGAPECVRHLLAGARS
ncbi:MAG: SUMF1/EgtB/PvdO family nonheme iron enzyme, partial [Planctomycetes bacterium]|nr:SUMF1/EgtB/PvdO family nonheme iron enzyme [Planctomycetota bacterium]